MGLRLALFGQAPFGRDTLSRLESDGHDIAAVYAPPEGKRPDPLAALAEEKGLPLFRHKRFRRKGEAIPELVEEHAKLAVDLNVLAFVTVILPPEIVDAPPKGSLCFHPSLLPAFRGGNALAWQIMLGASEAGVSVFQPDAGVDTGPIVVQKGPVPIQPTHTSASLYFDELYPLGIEAIAEAVAAVADGSAEYRVQPEAGASHQGLVDDATARLDWAKPAAELDRWVRGCDPQPGAWAERGDAVVRCYDGQLVAEEPGAPAGEVVRLEDGAAFVAASGGVLRIGRVRVADGPKQPAAEALSVGDRLR
ncbi:MAG: methionyl-tRNA formyltransferase [Myxococcota bacterium]